MDCHFLTILFLFRERRNSLDQIDVYNALIVKVFKASPKEQTGYEAIVHECLSFLKDYCVIFGSWTSFTNSQMDVIISGLIELTCLLKSEGSVQMNKPSSAKKGKKKANLNVVSESSNIVTDALQKLALQAMDCLIVSCHSLMSESHFKQLLDSIISEIMTLRGMNLMVQKTSSWKNRKELLIILRDITCQPSFPNLRPVPTALSIFHLYSNDEDLDVAKSAKDSITSLGLILRPLIPPVSSLKTTATASVTLDDEVEEEEEDDDEDLEWDRPDEEFAQFNQSTSKMSDHDEPMNEQEISPTKSLSPTRKSPRKESNEGQTEMASHQPLIILNSESEEESPMDVTSSSAEKFQSKPMPEKVDIIEKKLGTAVPGGKNMDETKGVDEELETTINPSKESESSSSSSYSLRRSTRLAVKSGPESSKSEESPPKKKKTETKLGKNTTDTQSQQEFNEGIDDILAQGSFE